MNALDRHELIEDPHTGHVTDHWMTNDNLDYGYPTEDASLKLTYPDLPSALNAAGGCRVGGSGVVVLVTLNGAYIDNQGRPLSEDEADYYQALPFQVADEV